MLLSKVRAGYRIVYWLHTNTAAQARADQNQQKTGSTAFFSQLDKVWKTNPICFTEFSSFQKVSNPYSFCFQVSNLPNPHATFDSAYCIVCWLYFFGLASSAWTVPIYSSFESLVMSPIQYNALQSQYRYTYQCTVDKQIQCICWHHLHFFLLFFLVFQVLS